MTDLWGLTLVLIASVAVGMVIVHLDSWNNLD